MRNKIIIYFLIAISLVCACIVWWKMPIRFLDGVKSGDISYIEVFNGSNGKRYKIEKAEDIIHITDNIKNIGLKKSGISFGKKGTLFNLTFYDKHDKKIDRFVLNSESIIRKDPFFYKTSVHSLCIDYLEQIDNEIKLIIDGIAISTVQEIRMFVLNGELYYDTQKTSDHTPRCGTLDGNLSKVVKENEIPKSDNGSNFDTSSDYFGYQTTGETTKEIPISGDWVIFKNLGVKKELTGSYNYCYYLKGTKPNTKEEVEYIALAKEENLSFTEATGKTRYSSFAEPEVLFIAIGG